MATSLLRSLPGLLLATALASGSHAQDRLTSLGLCPASDRLDDYVRALCDGEAALRIGNATEALARFRVAASMSRIDATNEFAWAGLAAAHCHARQFDSALQWQAHFTQARQLWLGDLDCDATDSEVRGRLSPFVRSRMCAGRLVADYVLLREKPTAPHALELKARLARVAEGLARSCPPAVSGVKAVGIATAESRTARTAKAKPKRQKAAVSPSRGKPRSSRSATQTPMSPSRER